MKMKKKIINRGIALICLSAVLGGCVTPRVGLKKENISVPDSYHASLDSTNTTRLNWRTYFNDEKLVALIDSALIRNQELNITTQEIQISKNEIRARKGEYLPFVGVSGSAGVEKAGRFTRYGAVEENLEIEPGTAFPEPFNDYRVGLSASWEVDIWKKLRNAKKAAVLRYLATAEGRNFMVTNLISEVANSYYELMALDNLLNIIEQSIQNQTNGFEIVKQQKSAAKVTQLAVNRFEAQLLHTKNLQFDIRQRIVETENKIRFLAGGSASSIPRNSTSFNDITLDSVSAGIPSQLLANRPDIRQAELQLEAAKIDVSVARANFYPSFRITAGAGFQAFNAAYLFKPESMLYNLAGDLMAPLINRNAITAAYQSAGSRQIQEVYNYERTILNAYLEVLNQLSMVDNVEKSYQTKNREVEILTQSITISNSLFASARADYLEVLLVQREALESRMDLVEIKMKRMNAKVNFYRALGGGWN
jgi:NodT family efflux transporter outer membrane factor (OMF) lipoprotein